MGKLLIKGEKFVIYKEDDSIQKLTVHLERNIIKDTLFDIDFFLFMLRADNSIDKNSIIFYNNPQSPCESIKFSEFSMESKSIKVFDINLKEVPQNISKLILGCSLYNEKPNAPGTDKVNITFSMQNKIPPSEIAAFNLPIDTKSITTVMIGEIYRYKGLWKFNAVEHCSNIDLVNAVRSLYNTNFY